MKFCVFSDVHGNAEAFSAAYPLMLAERVDGHLFLGDLCGYYFDQLRVFAQLRQLQDLTAVMGNHDAIFLDIVRGNQAAADEYRARYGLSMDNLLNEDHREFAGWLSNLPHSVLLDGGKVLAVHGSPSAPLTGYIYPDSPLEEFSQVDARVIVSGHSHYPMERVDEHGRLFLNPGSIGQPRGTHPPSYAVLDSDRFTVHFRTFDYDREKTLHRIDEIGDTTPYLKRVLRN